MIDKLHHASQIGGMALNLKNTEVERLAAEVAAMAGESKTEAIRKALLERKDRLSFRVAGADRRDRVLAFLREEVWPAVPRGQLGKRLSRKKEEAILGFGPEGV